VILINYANDQSQPVDAQTMDGYMAEVNQFYEEASYNQLEIVRDAYGYSSLPVDIGCTDTDFSTIASAGIQAMITAGIDLSEYQSYVFVGPPADSCATYAEGSVGASPGLVLIGYLSTDLYDKVAIISHELGHNLGYGEALTWACASASYGPPSQCSVKFSDLFDVMVLGDAYSKPPHFNATIKELFGW